MSTQTIIAVVGQPRSVTNGIAKFLARIGGDLGQQFVPTSNPWNTNWAEDTGTHAAIGNFLGLDANLGLFNPTRPASPDPVALAAMKANFQQRAVLAAPNPLVILVPPAVLTDIRAMLPAANGYNYLIVNLIRNTANRITSLTNVYANCLAADSNYPYTPSTAQITSYLAACDAARTTILTAAASQGVTVINVNVANIISAKATTLSNLAAALSLNNPQASDLAFIDEAKITAGTI